MSFAKLIAARCGSLRKAHAVLGRVAEDKRVAMEIRTDDFGAFISECAELGVMARPIRRPDVDVIAVRGRLGLSQAEFAVRFGFELDTIQNWEQGRNRPDAATQVLLGVIEARPEVVDDVLTGSL